MPTESSLLHWGTLPPPAVSLLLLILVASGCSTFRPIPFEQSPFLESAQTETVGPFTVTVAVPRAEEATDLFGVRVYNKGIQPVWLEVTNNSEHDATVFPYAMDPEYFSPYEAAYISHYAFSRAENKKMDAHFYDHAMSWFVGPGETQRGFVYTNLDLGVKMVNLAIAANREIHQSFFIVEVPGLVADYSKRDIAAIRETVSRDLTRAELRAELESMHCCTQNAAGTRDGDPVNFAVVSAPGDFLAALVSREWNVTEAITGATTLRTAFAGVLGGNYRYSPVSSLHYLDRPQDIAFQKTRGSVNQRNHMRLWVAPFTCEGVPVWIGQISRDIGVAITTKSKTLTTHVIDPEIDETRFTLLEDLLAVGAVDAFGFAKGVGEVTRAKPRENLTGSTYFTDGFRLVVFIGSEPTALNEVDILDWEWPAQYGERRQ